MNNGLDAAIAQAVGESALEYASLFEPGHFHLEIQPNGLQEQEQVNGEWKISAGQGTAKALSGMGGK